MTKLKLAPIEKSKLSQKAYDILLHHIQAQDFKYGQKLQVDDLSRQLGISRTPVKEALNLLAAEGLVELVPHIGTFVKAFTDQEIAEIFDIRRALEVLAAETMLDHLLPQHQARLEALVRSMGESLAKGIDLERHSRKNHDFHSMMVELSGNRRLVKNYESLHVSVRATQISANQETWKQSFDAEAAEHRAILAAIRAHDRTALMKAIALHLEHSKQRLMENLRMRERQAEEGLEAPSANSRQARTPRQPETPP